MMPTLNAFREIQGHYELVGELELLPDRTLFSYADEYLARPDAAPISRSLRKMDAEKRETHFFEGLLPEEGMRDAYNQALHDSMQVADGLLTRLNNESAGALIFGESVEQIVQDRGYDSLTSGLLEEFAHRPRAVALEMGMASRLSLAGAQSKMGLRLLNGSWYAPRGSAPSTHIVKATDGTFRDLAVNEAICLETARQLDFDVAGTLLIAVGEGEPLLAVKRFDRTMREGVPLRLHQEDFVQAKGFPNSYPFKYEPTDGHYLQLCESLVSQVSDNPFGDRLMFFQRLLFDYCIGNTDNHLKNHSFTWSEDWKSHKLSPLYDVTCCTLYTQLDREMGVSLCPSRRIDDVTRASILDVARSAGIAAKMAGNMLDEILGQFPTALHAARASLVAKYAEDKVVCTKIEEVAAQIEVDAAPRLRI